MNALNWIHIITLAAIAVLLGVALASDNEITVVFCRSIALGMAIGAVIGPLVGVALYKTMARS